MVVAHHALLGLVVGAAKLLLIFALVVAVLLVAAIVWARSNPGLRVRREHRELPIVPVASVREGQWVRVVGTARPVGETIAAPASARAALAFELEAGHHSPETGNCGDLRLHGSVDFVVDDGTGAALVAATQPLRLGLDDHRELLRVRACDAPEELLAGLEPRVRGIRRDAHGTVAMDEGVLEPGETVAVAGIARLHHAEGEPRVHIEPHPEHGLLVSDGWAATQR